VTAVSFSVAVKGSVSLRQPLEYFYSCHSIRAFSSKKKGRGVRQEMVLPTKCLLCRLQVSLRLLLVAHDKQQQCCRYCSCSSIRCRESRLTEIEGCVQALSPYQRKEAGRRHLEESKLVGKAERGACSSGAVSRASVPSATSEVSGALNLRLFSFLLLLPAVCVVLLPDACCWWMMC
jgi:hypothetical protein